MGEKTRHLCKWKKDDYESDLEKLRKIVGKPSVVCARCGRAAKSAKWVCKALEL